MIAYDAENASAEVSVEAVIREVNVNIRIEPKEVSISLDVGKPGPAGVGIETIDIEEVG